MFYRLLRVVREYYGLTFFGLYLAMFLIAFAFIAVYPIVPIAILFLAILMLVPVWTGGRVVGAGEHFLARRALRNQSCPSCGGRLVALEDGGVEVKECVPCQLILRADGTVWEPDVDGPKRPTPKSA